LYARGAPGSEDRASLHEVRVLTRRLRLTQTAFGLVRWLPPTLAVRLLADEAGRR
jgi:hypothetical protein